MPIILLGALGGIISGGIIGMFVGAVLLAVGYRVFMDWVAMDEEGVVAETAQGEAAEQAGSGSEQVN